MKRCSVTVNCVADRYHAPNERIVEFTFPSGKGGLISFRLNANGAEVVEVYRLDDEIQVSTPEQAATRTVVYAPKEGA